jgi:hypothetical protein
MHVVLYLPVDLHVTGHGRDVLLHSFGDDVADEPLLGGVCGKGQQGDEAKDHDGDGQQRPCVDPWEGY